MSKNRMVWSGLLIIVLSSNPLAQQAVGRDWKQVMKLPPGREILLSGASAPRTVVFAAASQASIFVVDPATVADEHARKAIPGAIREAVNVHSETTLLIKGVGVAVVEIARGDVTEIAVETTRANGGITAAATAAAAVAGFFLGGLAGIAADGGLGGDGPGVAVFFGVAIAVPLTTYALVHRATAHPYRAVVYQAHGTSTGDLKESDWRAVQHALPASLCVRSR